jgi:hypothetical protein
MHPTPREGSSVTSHDRTLLATIEAERAIYRTFYRIDTNQYERVGKECFTPDALIEYDVMPGPTQRFRGRDEFTAFMSAGPRTRERKVAHVIGQSVIEWYEGRPHLEAYATVWHWAASRTTSGQHRPADWTVVGLVEDDFEQVDGEWLISRRYVSPVAGLVATGRAPT